MFSAFERSCRLKWLPGFCVCRVPLSSVVVRARVVLRSCFALVVHFVRWPYFQTPVPFRGAPTLAHPRRCRPPSRARS